MLGKLENAPRKKLRKFFVVGGTVGDLKAVIGDHPVWIDIRRRNGNCKTFAAARLCTRMRHRVASSSLDIVCLAIHKVRGFLGDRSGIDRLATRRRSTPSLRVQITLADGNDHFVTPSMR